MLKRAARGRSHIRLMSNLGCQYQRECNHFNSSILWDKNTFCKLVHWTQVCFKDLSSKQSLTHLHLLRLNTIFSLTTVATPASVVKVGDPSPSTPWGKLESITTHCRPLRWTPKPTQTWKGQFNSSWTKSYNPLSASLSRHLYHSCVTMHMCACFPDTFVIEI